jgi:hypothetical protein
MSFILKIKSFMIIISILAFLSFYLYAFSISLFFPSYYLLADPKQAPFIFWHIINFAFFFIAFPIQSLLFVLLDIYQFEIQKAFIYHLLCLIYISLILFDPGGIILWVLD